MLDCRRYQRRALSASIRRRHKIPLKGKTQVDDDSEFQLHVRYLHDGGWHQLVQLISQHLVVRWMVLDQSAADADDDFRAIDHLH